MAIHLAWVSGADTELDHQIRCWQYMGIKVHICHTGVIDSNAKSMKMQERGCIIHTPEDWESVKGLHCISFCNGQFLENLPTIKKYAKTTSFVNCMTWNFPKELEMQEKGLIDFHLYQTRHAFDKVSQKLKGLGTYKPIMFTPYFHTKEFPYHGMRPTDRFRFGRISRGDADKYNIRQLWIYETMTAPVLKEGIILGWDDRAAKKFGHAPPGYIIAHPENRISQQEFYTFCDAIIMSTDTFENLPRVGFEAMASGSILVVDNRGGWKIQVEDGVTGWLCNDDREFVYKSARVAFEHTERNQMRQNALRKLKKNWGMETAAKTWKKVFEIWERT